MLIHDTDDAEAGVTLRGMQDLREECPPQCIHIARAKTRGPITWASRGKKKAAAVTPKTPPAAAAPSPGN